jgi:Tfp pilus assembly protein PilF
MFTRISVIIVLGLVAYGCMLKAPFKTMDDRISIIKNPMIKSSKNIPAIFREGYFHDQYYYRPLVNLSFMGEYHAFGLKPFFYNLDNLILHILNALLVFLLVSKLTNSGTIGFWTGLLFVIHPVQWEAVCNIPGRVILMSAFFVLSTFILFLEFYNDRRWGYFLLAMITFPLALLCKESAGVLPVVLIAYLCLDKANVWTRKAVVIGPFFIGIAGYIFLRHYVGISKVYHTDNPIALALGFMTFLRSVITDLRLFIFPVDLHYDRCLPFFVSFTYHPAVVAIVFWAVVLTALYAWRRKISPFIFFLAFWFALELLPVSQLVTGIGVGAGYVSTAEHFLYLACIPVFIGMVMAFRMCYGLNDKRHFVRPVFLKFLAGGFLAFLLLIAIEQSIYASNEFSMLERSLAFEPNNPRIQGAMGLLSVYRGDIPDAQKHFQAAVKAEPLNPTYHISLGTALCQQGRWIEGLEQFVVFDPGKDKALVAAQEKLAMGYIRQQLKQGRIFDARGWLAIGIHYAKIGRQSEAVDAFLKSVSLNPRQTDAWFNLGSVYEAQGNWPVARMAYKKLLALDDLTPFQRDFGTRHLAAIGGR